MSPATRLRSERGATSVELLGMISLLLLAALAAMQLLLAGWAVTSASNAARAGSRAEALGGDGERAAIEALSGPLRDGANAEVVGERATVEVRVPVVLPGLSREDLEISRTAELPGG
jgi:hypothetical protein